MKVSDIPKLKTGDLLDRVSEFFIFLYSTPGNEWLTVFGIGHKWTSAKHDITHYLLHNDTQNLSISEIQISTIRGLIKDKDKRLLLKQATRNQMLKIKKYVIKKYFIHIKNR